MFSKPLFHVTCGDLGTTASDVEKALEKNFALASKWGCILLLDEADVFLASRTPQDFIRNGLVSGRCSFDALNYKGLISTQSSSEFSNTTLEFCFSPPTVLATLTKRLHPVSTSVFITPSSTSRPR